MSSQKCKERENIKTRQVQRHRGERVYHLKGCNKAGYVGCVRLECRTCLGSNDSYYYRDKPDHDGK